MLDAAAVAQVLSQWFLFLHSIFDNYVKNKLEKIFNFFYKGNIERFSPRSNNVLSISKQLLIECFLDMTTTTTQK